MKNIQKYVKLMLLSIVLFGTCSVQTMLRRASIALSNEKISALIVPSQPTVSKSRQMLQTSVNAVIGSKGVTAGIVASTAVKGLALVSVVDPSFMVGALMARSFLGLLSFSVKQARLSTDQEQKSCKPDQGLDLVYEKMAAISVPESAMDKLVQVEFDDKGSFILPTKPVLKKYGYTLLGIVPSTVSTLNNCGQNFAVGFDYGLSVGMSVLMYKRYQRMQRIKSQEYLDGTPTNVYELAAALDEQKDEGEKQNQETVAVLNATCNDSKKR